MNNKTKHPFVITCRNCGSNNISVYAFDYEDVEIKCHECGKSIECRCYHMMSGDYSDC